MPFGVQVQVLSRAPTIIEYGGMKTNLSTNEEEHPGQFSESRLTAAAIFAFLPGSGVIGVHNFILKQYGKGALHIALVAIAFLGSYLSTITCNYNKCYNATLSIIFLQYLIVAASYIWAIVEGVRINQLRKLHIVSPPVINKPTIIQSEEEKDQPVMKMGGTTYYVAEKSTPKTVTPINQNKQKDHKVWSIVSIISALIPLFLWTYCIIISGGNTNEGQSSGGVWWLMIWYYFTIGFPLMIVSVAFGIIGLGTSLKGLATLSLIIKTLTIIFVMLLVSGVLF